MLAEGKGSLETYFLSFEFVIKTMICLSNGRCVVSQFYGSPTVAGMFLLSLLFEALWKKEVIWLLSL